MTKRRNHIFNSIAFTAAKMIFFGLLALMGYSAYAEIQLPYVWKTGDSVFKVVCVVPDGIIYEYKDKQLEREIKGSAYQKMPVSRLKDDDLGLFGLDRKIAEEFQQNHKITQQNLLGLKARRQDFIKQYGFPSLTVLRRFTQISLGGGSYFVCKEMYIRFDDFRTLTGSVWVFYDEDEDTPVIVKYAIGDVVNSQTVFPDYNQKLVEIFLLTTEPLGKWKSESKYSYYTDNYAVVIAITENKLETMTMINNDFTNKNAATSN